MIRSSILALCASSCLFIGGVSFAQAEGSEQAATKSSNANAASPDKPKAMMPMHSGMMKKTKMMKHHKAM